MRLHTLAPGEDFEIETPQYTFHFNRLGAYRVEAGETGDVVAAVRFGDAELFRSDGATMAVPRGKQARSAAGGSPAIELGGNLDQFETWCVERDRREDLSATAQYVSRDIPGYADLDEHGAWRPVDQYGMAWFPSNMDSDWAPYRSGHFISAGPWGMNWVDDASWGFGPLHYGRWLKVNGAWGWVPGAAGKSARPGAPQTFAVRPYYVPALVAWDRFAARVVRTDAVLGWFPLGPGEAWIPQFAASADYLARVNSSNTAIADPATLDNLDLTRVHYMYQEAMTAMGQDDLASGRPVGRQYVRVPRTAYAQGRISAQPGVQPTREAQLGPRGPAQGAPSEIASRPVVAHRVPVPPLAATYVRQVAAPQPPAGSSPRRAAAATPRSAAGSQAAAAHSSSQSVAAAPAAAQRSGPQPVAPAAVAVQRPVSKPVATAPAPHPGGFVSAIGNASKGVVNTAKGAATGAVNAAKGTTAKTGVPHPPAQANGKQPQPKPQTPSRPPAKPPAPPKPPPRPPAPRPQPPPPKPK